jgi:hypothetical protein
MLGKHTRIIKYYLINPQRYLDISSSIPRSNFRDLISNLWTVVTGNLGTHRLSFIYIV